MTDDTHATDLDPTFSNAPRIQRGKLKIFLGYATGVGKTYAMLEAAQQRLAAGIDVVAACVAAHGQAGTEAMLAGVETISRKQRLDLDAILARRPAIALVDNLAHTNPPDSRHAKRYQDVLELLNAGIDVYTTLNVQHLESLNDVIAQITGVTVHDTIPDYLLDEADDIELIDLPTGELLQRIEAGQVDVPDRASMRQFYRPGNLAALREIALRRAADRVDDQMRSYMETHAIMGPWPAGERLLVCVGPSPLSQRLVRSGRRLAAHLKAEWTAVYVETPAHAGLSEAARDRMARALRLAEELGAKSIRLPGQNVAEVIAAYAQTHNVTKIVAGKPLQPRWVEILRGSVIDQIIRNSRNVDVYVISGTEEHSRQSVDFPAPARSWRWRPALASVALVSAVTLLGLPLRGVIEPTNLVMFYLLVVIIAAIRLGRAAAILASLLSVIAFDVVFIPPYYTFVVADAQYLLTFAGLLGVSLIVSTLTARAREQAQVAQRREAQTSVLYELSRNLAAAAELKDVTQAVVTHVTQILGGAAAVLVHDGQALVLRSASHGYQLDAGEYAVAEWTYQHHHPSGKGTNTHANADGFYLPLRTAQEVVGVLGVFRPDSENRITGEQRRLLESFSSQAALAIERSQLAEEARRARLLHETEKLQTALLNSISHDLRTPLATITGTLSSLRDDRELLDEHAQRDLLDSAHEEAERLNRLVGNLLDMTRLEAGAMKISVEVADVEDAIGVALSQLAPRLHRSQIVVETPDELALAPMDFVLMVQVFVNLLDNAVKYSPAGAPITVRVYTIADELRVEIADHGPGIPPEELERIFDKFYRAQEQDGVGGTGLGLSISKGIVNAHGGRIWARNRDEGGAIFTVALPLAPVVAPPVEVVS